MMAKQRVIENSEGKRTTPAYVSFSFEKDQNDSSFVVVGEKAERQWLVSPRRSNILYASKLLMGRKFDDPVTQKISKLVSYGIVKAPNGDAWLKATGEDEQSHFKEISPTEVSAMILSNVKESAERFFGGDSVCQAVIAVPAHFTAEQRLATRDAGTMAGLKVLRVVNEPTTALLGLGFRYMESGIIVVFDLGGTFDVSVLLAEYGVFEVKAINGDLFLGGNAYDQVLVDHIVSEFKKVEGIDLSKNEMALQRIKDASERAKIELSSITSTEINLPLITADASGLKNLVLTLTREKFEQLTDDLIKRTLEHCKKCLEDAGVTHNDIDHVVLAGGMSRVPKIQRIVTDFFGKNPIQGKDPDEVVAMGAAIQAGYLIGNDSL